MEIKRYLQNSELRDTLVNVIPSEDAEIIMDDAFDYHGYQVVRGEFFAHVYEPSITFNNCKVYVNTACIKKLPTVDYVQILVNPKTKKLAVRPCREEDKDSFLWCTERNGKRIPKHITCRLFFAKLFSLMEWNPHYRYKILGKIIKNVNEYLILFDLMATEVYQRIVYEGEKTKASRTPVFPLEWQEQFGIPVEEHRRLLQVNIFDGYTVFGLQNQKRETKKDINIESVNIAQENDIYKEEDVQ